MKQPKKLTRDQKFILDRQGLDARKFSFISEDEECIVVWDKENETSVSVSKKRKK